MRFRGGEFSTGTTGNFQPELTAGRRADAERALDQLNELSKEKHVPAVDRARIYAGLGEKDKAFEWLEKSYEDRSIVGINVQPPFDPLRSDPRFADLLRRMNLQP